MTHEPCTVCRDRPASCEYCGRCDDTECNAGCLYCRSSEDFDVVTRTIAERPLFALYCMAVVFWIAYKIGRLS